MPDRTDARMTELADAAFRQAAIKVVRKAKEHGTPIVLWDDAAGTVRYVSPEECEELDRVAKTAVQQTDRGTDVPEPAATGPR